MQLMYSPSLAPSSASLSSSDEMAGALAPCTALAAALSASAALRASSICLQPPSARIANTPHASPKVSLFIGPTLTSALLKSHVVEIHVEVLRSCRPGPDRQLPRGLLVERRALT